MISFIILFCRDIIRLAVILKFIRSNLPTVFSVNSVHAMDKVRDWNACNTSLHPKTCTVLLKFLRTSFPEAIDAKDLVKQCIEVAGPSRSALVEALYEDISTSTFVGRTMEDLLVGTILSALRAAR